MHSPPSLRRAAVAVGLLLWSVAQAQTAPASRVDDPLDAKATVPPVVHRSSLAGYRAGGETRPVPWKQANDTVTRIGGWRAYAAAAELPASAPTPAAPTPPVQAPARTTGPGHHGKH